MNNKFAQSINDINANFMNVVDIINEVIEHRTNSFAAMLDVGEKVQADSEKFVSDTEKIVAEISQGINSKIDSLNMKGMKDELEQATKTFLSITEDLELLSYNTICRTMALGDKGATITHISKEIKKYSNTVKSMLTEITAAFSDVYEVFRFISDNMINSGLASASNSLTFEQMENLTITSDASILIENSQFHDIFTQELSIIHDALNGASHSDPYTAGLSFGLYEKAIQKFQFINQSLQDKLYNIESAIKDFIYSFNTDMQNIASKASILREELLRVEKVSTDICDKLRTMRDSTEKANLVIAKTDAGIKNLAKHAKTFKNLVVVTAIEVARINDEDLKSVVVSMIGTESELNGLIDKLTHNVELWHNLQSEFASTFSTSNSDLISICSKKTCQERNSKLEMTKDLENQINSFSREFSGETYLNKFNSNTADLKQNFDELNLIINDMFSAFSNSIPQQMLSDESFTQGRNDSELKDVLASEDEQSSIEFF